MRAALSGFARDIFAHSEHVPIAQVSWSSKITSIILALALAITMCPAAGLAYAAEGEGEGEANSTDNATVDNANAGSSAGSGSSDRVNEDVKLDTSGSSSAEGDAEDSNQPSSSESAVSPSANKYTSSSSDRVSADVSLAGDATVGTIEYNGLAYTIDEEDGSAVSVTGLATAKPTGDVQVPSQIASGGKLYAVTAVKAPGLSEDVNSYAESLFDDKAKALAVNTVSLPASVKAINPAFFQLFPNATDISVASDNEAYASYDGALYSADTTQLILVPQGKGSLVLPQSLASVPAYVFSQCNKLSAMSFSGSTGNSSFAVQNHCLYTSDMTTLLAAPAGLGASASIASGTQTIAEGAFSGNVDLDTIVVNGAVSEIAKAGDTALGSDGSALMTGSAVSGSTLPAFADATVASATVVINIAADGDEAAALIEQAKAAWVSYGFANFKEPAKPGTEIKPTTGSGFAFTLLPDYTLSVSWVGDEAAPAALVVPDYGVIDGVQYTVSTIASKGFYLQSDIIAAELPQTITAIGESAFEFCLNLQTIRFDSVVSIGAQAFANTALLSLVLPATVQYIGNNAFSNMKGSTIVALGSVANNSAIALGAATGLSVYVPLGTEGSWDAGIPAYSNHIYPYGVKLSQEPISLEVGQTANIADNGYLEAPGDIEVSYAYKAKPISIDQETGTIEAKAEGSSNVDVTLSIDLQEVVVNRMISGDQRLELAAHDSDGPDAAASIGDAQGITRSVSLGSSAVMATAAAPRAAANTLTIHTNGVPLTVRSEDRVSGVVQPVKTYAVSASNNYAITIDYTSVSLYNWRNVKTGNRWLQVFPTTAAGGSFTDVTLSNVPTGYTFQGFYTDKYLKQSITESEYKVDSGGTNVTNLVTGVTDIYLKFSFKVTFHSNGVPTTLNTTDHAGSTVGSVVKKQLNSSNNYALTLDYATAGVSVWKNDTNNARWVQLRSTNWTSTNIAYMDIGITSASGYTFQGFYTDMGCYSDATNSHQKDSGTTVSDGVSSPLHIYLKFSFKVKIHSNNIALTLNRTDHSGSTTVGTSKPQLTSSNDYTYSLDVTATRLYSWVNSGSNGRWLQVMDTSSTSSKAVWSDISVSAPSGYTLAGFAYNNASDLNNKLPDSIQKTDGSTQSLAPAASLDLYIILSYKVNVHSNGVPATLTVKEKGKDGNWLADVKSTLSATNSYSYTVSKDSKVTRSWVNDDSKAAWLQCYNNDTSDTYYTDIWVTAPSGYKFEGFYADAAFTTRITQSHQGKNDSGTTVNKSVANHTLKDVYLRFTSGLTFHSAIDCQVDVKTRSKTSGFSGTVRHDLNSSNSRLYTISHETDKVCAWLNETNGYNWVQAYNADVSNDLLYTDIFIVIPKGYVFDGFYSDSGYKNLISKGLQTGSGTVTKTPTYQNIKDVYIKFTPAPYTATFVIDGATSTKSIAYGTAISLPTGASTQRMGYKLTGWKAVSADGSVNATWTDSLSSHTMPASDMTLTAQWQALTYTVSFSAEAGTGAGKNSDNPTSPASVSFTYADLGTAKAKLATMGNTLGYTFGKWTKSDGSGSFASGLQLTASNFASLGFNGLTGANETVALKAAWSEKSFTITYDKNAAGASYQDGSAVMSGAVKYTSAITLPDKADAKIKYDGYNLSGWMASKSASSTITASKVSDVIAAVAATSTSAKDSLVASASPAVTVYAKWGQGDTSWTIMYHYQGTSDGAFDASGIAGKQGSGTTGDSLDIDVTIDGAHSHAGYSYVLDSTQGDSGQRTLAGSSASNIWHVYYKLQLTVTYKAGDQGAGADQVTSALDWGAPMPKPIVENAGSSDEVIHAAMPLAYEFKSWSEITDLDAELVTTDLPTTVTDNLTYVANWSHIAYAVTYAVKDADASKLTLPDTVSPLYYDELGDISLSGAIPAVGYSFAGWQDAHSRSYVAGEKIADRFTDLFPTTGGVVPPENRTVILMAKVSSNQYTVRFVGYPGAVDDDNPEITSAITLDADSANVFTAPGDADVVDSNKVWGYCICGWMSDNGERYFKGESYNLLGASDKGVPGLLDGLLADVAPDQDGKRYINLYANWTAVYSVAVPDETAVVSIDLSTREAAQAEGESVGVYNCSPHPVKLAMYSESAGDNAQNANDIFFGGESPNLSDDLANMSFSWAGTSFAVNGGSADQVLFDREIPAAVPNGDGSAKCSGWRSALTLAFADSIWDRVLASLTAHHTAGDDLSDKPVAKVTWLVGMADHDDDPSTSMVAPSQAAGTIWQFDRDGNATLVE